MHFIINRVSYTVTPRGLEDARAGWRSRLIPFTSMLTIEYFPGEQIKITLMDKSLVYITVDEASSKDKENLVYLYKALC